MSEEEDELPSSVDGTGEDIVAESWKWAYVDESVHVSADVSASVNAHVHEFGSVDIDGTQV